MTENMTLEYSTVHATDEEEMHFEGEANHNIF